MYQVIGNTVAISVNDWCASGLSYNQFNHDSKSGLLRIVERGINGETKIDVASIQRAERLRKIEAVMGKVPTPAKVQSGIYAVTVDTIAREFYSAYRKPDGDTLLPERQAEYTYRASIFNALRHGMKRQIAAGNNLVMKEYWPNRVEWFEARAQEFGIPPYINARSLERAFKAYCNGGYRTLIHGGIGSDNRRKVTYKIRRLLLSLDSLPQRPYNTTVAEMYTKFVLGELEVYNPETGEVYDPAICRDKKGEPVFLSDSTIANYLNQQKALSLRSKVHDTQHTYKTNYEPHHLRNSAYYAFSKISMDDRDLPRKLHNGRRVMAYYAYDVASGCIVGYAHNRDKNKELFLDCVRNMFQLIDRKGWNTPAQVEVEHHLVRNFADGLMQAGTIFPFVRWCNPGNDQEKRAEHKNRAKKYGVEKRNHIGIGRWYAELEANRTKTERVYDEETRQYTTKEKSYDYEQLVAEDIADIHQYNNMKHPNQKDYPGMTRWQVLCELQNSDLMPVDKPLLYRFIGEHTQTTIRRNMYMTVQYEKYWLPDPHLIERLEPRNTTVDAYYLPDEKGNIPEVYIYQNGRYIATCAQVVRYNEATIEQTEADVEAYTEQSKYVAKYRAMMKEDAIEKVEVIDRVEREKITSVTGRAVMVPLSRNSDDELDDYLNHFDKEAIKVQSNKAL